MEITLSPPWGHPNYFIDTDDTDFDEFRNVSQCSDLCHNFMDEGLQIFINQKLGWLEISGVLHLRNTG